MSSFPGLSQLNPIYIILPRIPSLDSNAVLPTPTSSKWSLTFGLSNLNCTRISHPIHVRYVPCRFYHPNNIWLRSEIMELLIVKVSQVSLYFIPCTSKYSPHHPVLGHTQSVLPMIRHAKFESHKKKQVKLQFCIF